MSFSNSSPLSYSDSLPLQQTFSDAALDGSPPIHDWSDDSAMDFWDAALDVSLELRMLASSSAM